MLFAKRYEFSIDFFRSSRPVNLPFFDQDFLLKMMISKQQEGDDGMRFPSRWWFLTLFFSPPFGEDSHFDDHKTTN